MNHCRKCQSDYEKPGTCNCFAPAKVATESADYWRGYWDGQRNARGWTWYQPYPWQSAPYSGTVTYTTPVTGDGATVTWANTDASLDAKATTSGFLQVGGGTC